MKILRNLFTFLSIITLTGCSPEIFPFFYDTDPSLPVGPAYALDPTEMTCLIQEFTAELKHDKHLNLDNSKIFYDTGIHAIQLEFSSQNIIELCEARQLIVSITEELLKRINLNSDVGIQLANYPFQPENLEIYLTFETYFGRYIDVYYVHWICLEDGDLTYYIFDLNDTTKDCWHSRHESYETAKTIAKCEEKAEKKYFEEHAPNMKVFGDQRYIPKDDS